MLGLSIKFLYYLKAKAKGYLYLLTRSGDNLCTRSGDKILINN